MLWKHWIRNDSHDLSSNTYQNMHANRNKPNNSCKFQEFHLPARCATQHETKVHVENLRWDSRQHVKVGSPGCFFMTPSAAGIQVESTWSSIPTIRHSTQCSVVIQQCHLLSEITTCPSSFNMMLPEEIASASHAKC